MKLDMHCHVNEGSIDSKVDLEEYIHLLKSKGYGGMLVTDHDTYNGYRKWKHELKEKINDFVVLKGIEYDTHDAGHMICVMPEGVRMRLLELRGLELAELIQFVHRHGGILGPAHPFGSKYQSFATTKVYRHNPKITYEFDFIETFNACEPKESNIRAARLAKIFDKPGIGGSDAHKIDCVGLGFTKIADDVKSENEFIRYIKTALPIHTGGTLYGKTTKDKIGKAGHLIDYAFWIYNKGGALLKARKRSKKRKIENPSEPLYFETLQKHSSLGNATVK